MDYQEIINTNYGRRLRFDVRGNPELARAVLLRLDEIGAYASTGMFTEGKGIAELLEDRVECEALGFIYVVNGRYSGWNPGSAWDHSSNEGYEDASIEDLYNPAVPVSPAEIMGTTFMLTQNEAQQVIDLAASLEGS